MEVVADDFVAIGFGCTQEEAIREYDKNLAGLLNPNTIKFRMNEVPFIGYVATKDGLSVDPCKVQAILEMPIPANVSAIQQLLVSKQVFTSLI